MKQVYTLTEYSELTVADYRLSDEEREYLTLLSNGSDEDSKVKISFVELRSGLRFRSFSWVGVIELEDIRLVITPKFDRGFQALIDMICFVEQLPFYKWQQTDAELGTHHFMELFARLYVHEIEKLINIGIVKEYVTEEANLSHLRGRPDFIKNIQHNYTLPHRLYCRYDELATNIPENQVINKGLEIVQRFPLLISTRKKLNRLRTEMEQWCEPYVGDVFPDFYYHRLNAHYDKVHKLTAYLFEHLAVKNIYRFKHTSFFNLLIDMNALFERFVVTLFKRYLPQRYKVSSSSRVTKAITVNGQSYRHIIPDAIISDRHSGEILVVDMKYKNYAHRDIANSDICQLAFYAQYFHQKREAPHRSIIIYPRFKDTNPEPLSIHLLPDSTHRGVLEVNAVSIENCLSDVMTGEEERLQTRVMELIGVKDIQLTTHFLVK